jgi:asparagine synthase (glutamine-hydrolysing)
MCGIAGILHFDPERPVAADALDRMTDALVHRGPDDRGAWRERNIGLGFRRLRIIDLTAAGHQPMANEDQTRRMVFNGEIYNYPDLRRELEQRGHVFRSATDSETIVHGYEEWGAEVVHHLDGMFAFAIWDQTDRSLFLARDRYGIKPLHYVHLPRGFLFASEIKALLQHPDVPRDLDLQALGNFLTFAQVPAPETIYRAIRKLPPAHAILIRNGQVRIYSYYDLPAAAPARGSPAEAAAEVRRRLEQSVVRHLVADVPVGCCLSGGLDSALIAALAARHTSGRLKTFSVTFPDSPAHDERPFQQELVRQLDTEHYELPARLQLVEELPRLLQATDEPFAISSFLPLSQVLRLAARHVKVVLSGDGSDELFAGYEDRYFREFRRGWAGRLLGGLPWPDDDAAVWNNRTLRGRLARKRDRAGRPELERYLAGHTWFSAREKRALLQPDARASVGLTPGAYLERQFSATAGPPLRRRLRYEFGTSLADEMLTKMDRASSAVSLEGRVPFLSRALVEYAWNLPPEWLWRAGRGKQVLKEAARGLLPAALIDRPKAGFVVPVSRWIREDRRMVRPMLEEPQPEFDALINPSSVRSMLAAHDAGRGEHGERLWALFVLKSWFQFCYSRRG